jgi:hypothetical protein
MQHGMNAFDDIACVRWRRPFAMLIRRGMLVNVPRLVTAYFSGRPDPAIPAQRVSFGTSGHRGSAL